MPNNLEHTHRCRRCGYVVRAKAIDFKAISTGLITCPNCEKTDEINIEILSKSEIETINKSIRTK